MGSKDFDESKLSYTVKKKSKKIIELNNKVENMERKNSLTLIICTSLLFYVIIFWNRYISYATDLFNGNDIQVSFLQIDVIMLILLAVALFIQSYIYNQLKGVKKKYNQLRESLIETIDSGLCNCNNTCSCKDNYIKWMENKGIDLIFI